jgi:hypothetical protein
MPRSRLYQRIDGGNIVAPKPVERRAIIRNRVLKAGTIEFDGGAVNCMVRNMTELGAMLDVASSVGIPDDLAPKFYSAVSSLLAFGLPCWAVGATGAGAEPLA